MPDMEFARAIADYQFDHGVYAIYTEDELRNVCVMNPWYEQTGRWEFNSDAKAREYWGELFDEFVEKCEQLKEFVGKKTGCLITVTRYGENDYSAWWRVESEKDNPHAGYSVRGTLAQIINEIMEEV